MQGEKRNKIDQILPGMVFILSYKLEGQKVALKPAWVQSQV